MNAPDALLAATSALSVLEASQPQPHLDLQAIESEMQHLCVVEYNHGLFFFHRLDYRSA